MSTFMAPEQLSSLSASGTPHEHKFSTFQLLGGISECVILHRGRVRPYELKLSSC